MSLRRCSVQPEESNHINSRLSAVRVAMQRLHSDNRPRKSPPVTNEIVFISDDEGDVAPRRRIRHVSVLSESWMASSPPSQSSDHDLDSSQSGGPRRERHRRPLHKRPRLEHPEPMPARPKKQPTVLQPGVDGGNNTSEQPKEYTKLHLSFPKKGAGDDRAELTFRNGSSSAKIKKRHQDRSHEESVKSSAKSKTRPQQADPQPYIYDAILEVNMYCGPGYEKFPVVLGSVKGHTELCAEWDVREENRKAHRHFYAGSSTTPGLVLDLEESDKDNLAIDFEGPPGTSEDEQVCLAEVLQIFPQISHKFVTEKYRKHVKRHNTIENNYILELPRTADIVAEIADLDSFPKEIDDIKEKSTALKPEDETGTTVQWNKDIVKNPMYFKEAIILLARHFNHVPTHYISKTMTQKQALFDTFVHITECEHKFYTGGQKPYSRSRNARVQLEKKYELGHRDRRDGHQYVSLVNEFQAAKQYVKREQIKLDNQKLKDEADASNLAFHKAQGSLVECQCCFDDEIPMNRAVTCEGDTAHFFCFGCVAQLAETQVGLMKYEMNCMDGSGCKSALSVEGIGKAVHIKVFDKLAFNQQQAEISAAGIEGLEQCPFCEFKAICDPVEVDSVFRCQNPDCGRSSCRKCQEDSHLPRSCAEAKADKGLSARHLVEEARSEAMIRACPKCKVKIVKELGCNKMRCTGCSCLMCYVCKKDISTGRDGGYEHFNKAGAVCKLYDAQGEDRHADEADEAEREAIKKVKEADDDVDDKMLRVDTKEGDLPGQRRQNNVHAQLHEHHHHQLHQHIHQFNDLPGFAAFGQAVEFPPIFGQGPQQFGAPPQIPLINPQGGPINIPPIPGPGGHAHHFHGQMAAGLGDFQDHMMRVAEEAAAGYQAQGQLQMAELARLQQQMMGLQQQAQQRMQEAQPARGRQQNEPQRAQQRMQEAMLELRDLQRRRDREERGRQHEAQRLQRQLFQQQRLQEMQMGHEAQLRERRQGRRRREANENMMPADPVDVIAWVAGLDGMEEARHPGGRVDIGDGGGRERGGYLEGFHDYLGLGAGRPGTVGAGPGPAGVRAGVNYDADPQDFLPWGLDYGNDEENIFR